MNPISNSSTAATSTQAPDSKVVDYPKVRPIHSVHETETSWEVTVELPGVAKSAVVLRTENHQLVLEGTTNTVPGTWQSIRAERSPVTFTLRLQFPANVALQETVAKAEHGVLQIQVPKPQAARAVAIEVL